MVKKSDKLPDETPKFPHPVPATKREQTPPVKPVKGWVKPVKTAEVPVNSTQKLVKPVKTAAELVCPWPKCEVTGDKVFLAKHLRVHEKFSNQV